MIIARTTVQHVTRGESKTPETKQILMNYNMILESSIGADEFMLNLYTMDAIINKEFITQEQEDVWEESYQGLSDSPNMENVMDQENT